jgi:hypothetical protein
MRRRPTPPTCRECKGRMLIAWSGLVCENGCGRIQSLGRSAYEELKRRFPELVIRHVPVSEMRLSSY